jgi:N utilization substance protein A
VVSVTIDEENRIANVTVPERMLSLAIGREGQNARLAAKLTGWRIDIRSDQAKPTDTPSRPAAKAGRESSQLRRGEARQSARGSSRETSRGPSRKPGQAGAPQREGGGTGRRGGPRPRDARRGDRAGARSREPEPER